MWSCAPTELASASARKHLGFGLNPDSGAAWEGLLGRVDDAARPEDLHGEALRVLPVCLYRERWIYSPVQLIAPDHVLVDVDSLEQACTSELGGAGHHVDLRVAHLGLDPMECKLRIRLGSIAVPGVREDVTVVGNESPPKLTAPVSIDLKSIHEPSPLRS